MFLHVSDMQNALLAMFAFARLKCVILVLVEMSNQVGVEQLALDIAKLFAERQREWLEAIRTEVAQRWLVLLFDVVDGVGVEGGPEATGVTAVRHLLVAVRVVQVGYQLAELWVLQLTYSALVLAELFHVFLVLERKTRLGLVVTLTLEGPAMSFQHRHMHPIKPKGLSSGLSFQFFEYLSFEFKFEYFANLLQISKKMV